MDAKPPASCCMAGHGHWHLRKESSRELPLTDKPVHARRLLICLEQSQSNSLNLIGRTTCVLMLGLSVASAQDTARQNSPTQNSPAVQDAGTLSTPSPRNMSADSSGSCSADPQPGSERLDPSVRLENAPSTYVPLTGREKFHAFVKSSYTPYTFFSAAFGATLAQAQGQWYEYGGGMEGWGKRFGATLTDTESRRFIQGFVLSTLLHQDPRYFYSTKTRTVPRLWYAATRVLVTRSDRGYKTFNSSEFLGALFTSSLQNSYYTNRDRGLDETMNRFLGALSSDASSNILREFTPDIKRMFKRHAPQRIQRIEQKLPLPPEDK